MMATTSWSKRKVVLLAVLAMVLVDVWSVAGRGVGFGWSMVELIFNVGNSTCYVGFIRGEQEISFGHDEGHVRCFFIFIG